jgi:translation initiation factor IF-1
MPKNTKGGTGHKKQKNSSAHPKVRRAVDIGKKSDEFEVYGRVLRSLGNRRMEVYTQIPNSPSEYQTVVCRIRGSLRKRIVPDDYVLVQLFDFNLKQGQIADVYTLDEVQSLVRANVWDMTSFKPDETGRPVDVLVEQEEEDWLPSEEDSSDDDDSEDIDVI